MPDRFKMTTLNLVHLEANVVKRNYREIIARQLNPDVVTLTQAEMERATVDRLVRQCRSLLERAEGSAITGMAIVSSDDDPGLERLAVTLANGYVLLTPGKRSGVL
ncbi:hypothetical protein [Paraburkholderia acidiphila]|uniref:Uncharacterized protein n=1 Tax=Paraburkholderia acidiphila TaxID=2571747 RepID=A0A7Z2G8J9_9BURK|nr:hypothetical protein [Paraburkholderia acidiphila]QGZ57180.1 hypothetical protein FAZ97_19835 [Paraburkholderia acidiphila]